MSARDGVQPDDGTFLRATLDEILERKQQRAVENFGADVDLSQGSPVKQIIDTTAVEHEYLWKVMEEVYYSAYYAEAHGEQLDKLLDIAAINRRPRRGATGVVNMTTSTANDQDIIIPEGTRVATLGNDERPAIPFKTTEPARIEAGAAAVNNIPIRACEPWESDLDKEWLGEETNVAANTITQFQTPTQGVDEVTNPYPTGATSREHGYSFIEGRDRENDKELRERFERQFGSEAHATLDSIRANLLDTQGVLNVGVEENVTMQDNAGTGGLPPKSFRATILGEPTDADVAQTIFNRRPAGIQSWGDYSGTAVDGDGNERVERWDWADETTVYVDVDITHTSEYPHDGNLQVENRIIKEIGGTTVGGTEYVGTGMGEDVVYDIIHSACMSIRGVWNVDLEMGTASNEKFAADVEIQEANTALTEHDLVNVFNVEEERP